MQDTLEVQEWVDVLEKFPDVQVVDVVIKDEYGVRRGTDVTYQMPLWGKTKEFHQFQHTDNGMQWIDITRFVTHWKYLPKLP